MFINLLDSKDKRQALNLEPGLDEEAFWYENFGGECNWIPKTRRKHLNLEPGLDEEVVQ